MELKIKKVSDKLNLDVEAQWNCNSSTNCYGPVSYSDGPPPPVTGPGAIYVCASRVTAYGYSTEGWSIF